MSKKLQGVIWLVVAIVAVALIGVLVYFNVVRYNEGNIHPEISFEFENYGKVKFELYPEYAPNTVANIIKLAESGYYDDKVLYGKDGICLYFGRDINGEVEDPSTETIDYPTAEPFKYAIDGEFVSNGFNQNTLRHEKGVISLIRNDYTQMASYLGAMGGDGSSLYDESYNSGNAQIGIMMDAKASNLNGVYAAFGKVVEGMDVLEKIYNDAEIAVEEPEETDEETTENVKSTEKEEVENEEEKEEAAENETAIKKFATFPKVVEVVIYKHGIDYGMPKVHEVFDYEGFMNDFYSKYMGLQN